MKHLQDYITESVFDVQNQKQLDQELDLMLSNGKEGPVEFVKKLESMFPTPDKSRTLPKSGKWIYWDSVPKKKTESWRLCLLDWEKGKQLSTEAYNGEMKRAYRSNADNRLYIIKHGECTSDEQLAFFDSLWNAMEKNSLN